MIKSVDTLINNRILRVDTILKVDTSLVKHSDSAVFFAIPPDSGSDPLFLKFLSLPLSLGLQWTVMDSSYDIFFPLIKKNPAIGTVRLGIYNLSVTEATDTVRYAVGGHDYPCFDLATTDSTYGAMTAFGDLVIPLITVIDSGDTIGFSQAESSTRTFYNTSLTVPLWSRKVTTGLDSNYFNRTSHRYTSRQETFLTVFYDPWRGDTVFTK
jgi:hypothetical protein